MANIDSGTYDYSGGFNVPISDTKIIAGNIGNGELWYYTLTSGEWVENTSRNSSYGYPYNTYGMAYINTDRLAIVQKNSSGGATRLLTLNVSNSTPSSWAQVGNALTLTTSAEYSIAKLDTNTVALLDRTNGVLSKYSWDGTDWTLVGSSLTGLTTVRKCFDALTSSRIAMVSTSDLRTYEFNGSTWSLVGSGFTISSFGTNSQICAISSSEVFYKNSGTNAFRKFNFGGSTWSEETINTWSYTVSTSGTGALFTMRALNATRFVVGDYNNLLILDWKDAPLPVIEGFHKKYTSGSDLVYEFNGSTTVRVNSAVNVDWLLVAGGGGSGYHIPGGGGGGGVKDGTAMSLSIGTYPFVCGAGGAWGISAGNVGGTGGNSTFNSQTANGSGGGAGSNGSFTAGSGGSGGGAGSTNPTGNGTGTSGQGSNGGQAKGGGNNYPGGGGGGGSAVGQTPASNTANGGNGGAGKSSTITGSTTYWGGGGGGASYSSGVGGTGGTGGGANAGASPFGGDGTRNTGGGGGGGNGSANYGGYGGSGKLILKHAA